MMAPWIRLVAYVANWKPAEASQRSMASINPKVPNEQSSSTPSAERERRAKRLATMVTSGA